MELKVNISAILVAVLVNIVLANLWYMPLFGKAWGREMGHDPSIKPEKSLMIRGMLFMVIGNFLFAWVLAHNIAAWSFVPGANEMNPLTSGLSAAIFTWLGFYVPGELGATVWQKHSWKLFGINTGYQLVALLVASLILTHWR
jgi:hypothetical protein